MALNSQNLNNDYAVTQFYAGSYFASGDNALAGAQDNGTHYWRQGAFSNTLIYDGDGSFAASNQQN